MIERSRLARVPDDTTCVAVIITASKRYEQDQPSVSYPNVRHTFPDFPASDECLAEWADRVIEL